MVCKMSSFQNMLPSRIGNGCEGQVKHKEINTGVAAPHRVGGKGGQPSVSLQYKQKVGFFQWYVGLCHSKTCHLRVLVRGVKVQANIRQGIKYCTVQGAGRVLRPNYRSRY